MVQVISSPSLWHYILRTSSVLEIVIKQSLINSAVGLVRACYK